MASAIQKQWVSPRGTGLILCKWGLRWRWSASESGGLASRKHSDQIWSQIPFSEKPEWCSEEEWSFFLSAWCASREAVDLPFLSLKWSYPLNQPQIQEQEKETTPVRCCAVTADGKGCCPAWMAFMILVGKPTGAISDTYFWRDPISNFPQVLYKLCSKFIRHNLYSIPFDSCYSLRS